MRFLLLGAIGLTFGCASLYAPVAHPLLADGEKGLWDERRLVDSMSDRVTTTYTLEGPELAVTIYCARGRVSRVGVRNRSRGIFYGGRGESSAPVTFRIDHGRPWAHSFRLSRSHTAGYFRHLNRRGLAQQLSSGRRVRVRVPRYAKAAANLDSPGSLLPASSAAPCGWAPAVGPPLAAR